MANRLTWAGTAKNPVAIDTYKNLYANLDNEFYLILNIYSWHKSGLIEVRADNLPYKIALGLKYLIDYNEIINRNFNLG